MHWRIRCASNASGRIVSLDHSIGATGIAFFYNIYEIASYADGPTELLLTYHEITDLLKPDGLMAPLREQEPLQGGVAGERERLFAWSP